MNLRVIYILIMFAILSAKLFSQKHYYDLLPEIPAAYAYDPQQTYKQYIGSKDSVLKGKDAKEYAEALAYYHYLHLKAGMVYFNCTEIENYIQKLVNNIKLKNNITKELKVFLIRNEDNNATASDNGIVYVYIGLLANIPDEAALVSVLGHEISHALNNDQRRSVQLENKFKKENLKSVLSQSHGNRAFEARADDYGFNVATSMDYDIRSEYKAIIKFESDYRWYKSQYSYEDPKWQIYVDKIENANVQADSLEKLLSSHPDNFKRIAAMKKFIAQKNGDKQFIEDKDLFYNIRQKARSEQLYIDFCEGDYLDCAKNAFYYHLLDQKNPDYIYYISESLRRFLLYKPKLAKRGFLTHDNKDAVFEKNKGILRDLSYISLDSNFILMMAKDSVYNKTPKPFETYQQAYNFFSKKAAALNAGNINLTLALAALAEKNSENANLYFKKHIQSADPNHKEFSRQCIDGNLLSGFESHQNNLVYIKEPNYFYRESGKIKYSFIESGKYIQKIKEIFNDVITTTNTGKKELLYEDTLNIIESNFYSDLLAQLQYFKTEQEAQDEFVGLTSNRDTDYWNARAANDPKDPEVLERQKDFFYLEPTHWKFFKEKQVASIMEIIPYIYTVNAKTYFYLELSYFDPFNKKYIYFDQEYLEVFNKSNVKKVLKKFSEKISFKN